MTIKIPVKVPFGRHTMGGSGFYRVDIATWRKIMAVIKEVDLAFPLPPSLFEKVEALRRHLSKK